MTVLFDSETNGLLHELDRIHCLCLFTPGDPAVRRYHDQPGLAPRDGDLATALRLLEEADEIVAHNYFGFDKLALQKVYPGWKPRGRERDSLIIGRTVWPEEHLKRMDATNMKRGRAFPKQYLGRHSLAAWGYRLKDQKGESPASWAHLTPEMLDYCVQDVIVLALLWRRIQANAPTEAQIDLEQAYAQIIRAQEERGFRLDRTAVDSLVAALTIRRAELDQALTAAFPPFQDKRVTPKKKLERVDITPFNANSRAHAARAMREKYGWKPAKFTPTGQPQIDEGVLGDLPYPEAPLLLERLMIKTRLGQVAEGDQAWLKLVKADGRVYGRVAHNAAVTGRVTHSKPNMSAVPKVKKPWGPECRRCWVAAPGHKLVVVDASGIDARVLAHYAHRYDGGDFVSLIMGGDVHTRNMESIGDGAFWEGVAARVQDKPREIAKRVFYAILYGAKARKIGSIMQVGMARGKQARDGLLKGLPGLGRLIAAVTASAEANGWIRTFDGRRLWVRRAGAALSVLGQGGSAILMKMADVIAREWTEKYQVMVVHDEMVCEVPDALAEDCAAALVSAVKAAGVHFKLKIPLDAHAAIGLDWSCK